MIHRTVSPLVLTLFSLWALAALVAVARGLFVAPQGEPSRLLAAQLAGVAILFLALVRGVLPFRRAIQRLDPAFLTALQSWRVLGMMFLFLMVLGELPPIFAIPAGLGDVLVGLAAPVLALRMRQGNVSRRVFAVFTAFGLLDFLAALSFGNWVNLHPERYDGFASMSAWPLVLVPGFFVPAFALAHLAAWVSFAARLAGAAGSCTASVAEPSRWRGEWTSACSSRAMSPGGGRFSDDDSRRPIASL